MKILSMITVLGLAGVLSHLTPPARAADNQLSAAEKANGWMLLFDGKTPEGWMTSARKPSARTVEDGCLNPHRSGHYMLVHTQQWSNFVLSLDFKISKKCNSGIFIRTSSLDARPGRDVGFNGIEVAIDDTAGSGFTDTGALYDLSKPSRNAMKPVGEWNHIEITCAGTLITVVLNQKKVNEVDLAQFTEPGKRPDGTAHKFDEVFKDHSSEGYIGLQDHGADCWFKNIKLRPIKNLAAKGP